MATNDRLADRSQNRPLRIAMVLPPWLSVPPPGYGGVEHLVAGLVDALVDRGHQVTLFGAGRQHGTAADFVSTVPRTAVRAARRDAARAGPRGPGRPPRSDSARSTSHKLLWMSYRPGP